MTTNEPPVQDTSTKPKRVKKASTKLRTLPDNVIPFPINRVASASVKETGDSAEILQFPPREALSSEESAVEVVFKKSKSRDRIQKLTQKLVYEIYNAYSTGDLAADHHLILFEDLVLPIGKNMNVLNILFTSSLQPVDL